MSAGRLVSVVIPCYNGAEFLAETVESALAQTHVPVEVIVVDDGSTDGTRAVMESFGGRILAVHQSNGGVANARNHGLRLAEGDYVCFLDADDWLAPTCLQRKVALMEADPELGLVFSRVELTDEHLNREGEYLEGTTDRDATGALLRLIPPAVPCPSNVLLRTAIVEEVGGFDERLSTSADYDMWLRVASGWPVGRVDEVLVLYRRHEGAMFHNLDAYVHDMELIIDKHRASLGAHPEWPTLRATFYRSVAGEHRRRGRYLAMIGSLLKGGPAALRASGGESS